MRKRLVILTTSLLIMSLIFFVGLFVGNSSHKRILLAVQLITITYILIYVFGGIGKLVSSLIYGMILALLLVLLPKYDTALIFIGTFIFALNPLAEFEVLVEKRFPEERSFISYLRGTYEPYYEYRKEIKNYYHLPQMRKIFTKPNYLKLRQALTIIMSMLAIFLLIREVNNLINLLKQFDINKFFASTYSVVILVSLTIILYRKGFQSMINILTVSIFPPIAYSFYLMILPGYLGIILGTGALLLGVYVGIYQYLSFRNRIVYECYYYYDNDKQAEVYANALFEPFVYNENFHLSTTFKIKTNITNFNKFFHNIIVYADLHRFFITAYTNNRSEIVLYTDFHYQAAKKIAKFKSYLEGLFEDTVATNVIIDKEKKFYETEFFHNNDYIVARTIYLAELLKKLEIKSSIIVSMTVYFETIEDVQSLSNSYSITRIPELDLDNIITARIDMKVANVDYIIDARVRELLLELLINRGTYIRVSVYY